MLKRAVITGMGVVSPNGMGNTAFCRAVLAGKSGVKTITRFDTSDVDVKIAGEVQDFDELEWVEARDRKHLSRVVPLSIAASTEALRDAGIDPQKLSLDEQREIGVVLGSGGGAQEFRPQTALPTRCGKSNSESSPSCWLAAWTLRSPTAF
jgi:3-oxoacyl-[acyl-carrier-protein] synthase II